MVFIYMNALCRCGERQATRYSESSPYRYAAASLFMGRAEVCVAPLLDCNDNSKAGERIVAWLDGPCEDERQVCYPWAQATHNHDVIYTSALQHAGRGSRGRPGRGLDGDGDRLGVAINRPRPLIADRASSTDAEARFLAYTQVQLRGWFQWSSRRHAIHRHHASSAAAYRRCAKQPVPG